MGAHSMPQGSEPKDAGSQVQENNNGRRTKNSKKQSKQLAGSSRGGPDHIGPSRTPLAPICPHWPPGLPARGPGGSKYDRGLGPRACWPGSPGARQNRGPGGPGGAIWGHGGPGGPRPVASTFGANPRCDPDSYHPDKLTLPVRISPRAAMGRGAGLRERHIYMPRSEWGTPRRLPGDGCKDDCTGRVSAGHPFRKILIGGLAFLRFFVFSCFFARSCRHDF